MYLYDLVIKNVHIKDPINKTDSLMDIGIADGKISVTQVDIPIIQAKKVIDLTGYTAIPGIIDPHTHVSEFWGSNNGQAMLAKAGICTTLDMAGPLEDILNSVPQHGAGLNVAVLQFASPPYTLADSNPSVNDIRTLVETSLHQGAYGVKLLGGHYPLTPEASGRLIEEIAIQGGYVAWHAGTTQHGSNIEGMREAVTMANGHFLHLAHINSYCRGAINSELEETQEAIELLINNPNIYSESYISPLNGTSLACKDGVPISKVTCNSLIKLGFTATEAGMEQAFRAGKVGCVINGGSESIRICGEEGIKVWRENGTELGGMFPVNPPLPRIMLAQAKRKSGDFVVDCLSTDGGCLPRNVLVEKGLGLVFLDVITLDEFIIKTSWNPSRMLRLSNKGSLGIGMDADITVLDIESRTPVATIVGGNIVMYKGLVCGQGSTIICTRQGEETLKKRGIRTCVADPSQKPLAMSLTR
ncbi:amidohydrolase family protein [Budviciaceae bacterium BWR-B9]|uniref:Amidohydrolase family protein n=1 Tax=Limnobaculum allomyrinae TaxID=2791986 RepID=A0ABS1ITK0_9GAMM|nr:MULTISPECIES: amidohydrolase family protein [Limnobaculum]MBK5145073.1 amidohydrolase family protein [Limnobaculum allomyrinae]MBV7692904.1 amidohydrolase family protein [Limnobaculum sp. M2-1]